MWAAERPLIPRDVPAGASQLRPKAPLMRGYVRDFLHESCPESLGTVEAALTPNQHAGAYKSDSRARRARHVMRVRKAIATRA